MATKLKCPECGQSERFEGKQPNTWDSETVYQCPECGEEIMIPV